MQNGSESPTELVNVLGNVTVDGTLVLGDVTGAESLLVDDMVKIGRQEAARCCALSRAAK